MNQTPGFYYFLPVAVFIVVLVSVSAMRIRAGFKPRLGNYLVWAMCAVFVLYMVWMGMHSMRVQG